MDSKPLIIAYSGSLDAFENKPKNTLFKKLIQWFWTYKHDTVDASTRSAYYLIKALAILKSKYQIGPDKIKFHFWGNINPINKKQAQINGVSEYFEFSGYLPKEESLSKLNRSNLLFLPLEKSNSSESGTLFIPGKLYEYLNSGKPILGLCEDSDCKSILEKSGLGICVEPDNPDRIAALLNQLVTQPNVLESLQANKDFIAQFDFRNKTSELARVFESLIVK
jgi:glycosyltransferase involved in cell wall biosynthesis